MRVFLATVLWFSVFTLGMSVGALCFPAPVIVKTRAIYLRSNGAPIKRSGIEIIRGESLRPVDKVGRVSVLSRPRPFEWQRHFENDDPPLKGWYPTRGEWFRADVFDPTLDYDDCESTA